ncbi:MAG: hypothetical protein HYV19_12045 [Gemmatimonadetes bacterium]|nr:hypothetical protein [Gemmatimonadota bacterium]
MPIIRRSIEETAEGEHLPRERGGAQAGVSNLHEVRAHTRIERLVRELQFGDPVNRRQDVVEVVGDSAGEAAHGLQALRLPESFGEVARRRHVFHHRDAELDAPLGVAHGRNDGVAEDGGPAVEQRTDRPLRQLASAAEHVPHRVRECRVFRRISELREVAVDERVAGGAPHSRHRRIRLAHAALQIHHRDADDGRLEQGPKPALVLARGAFRAHDLLVRLLQFVRAFRDALREIPVQGL